METHIVEDPQSQSLVASVIREALADPTKEVPDEDFISNLPAAYRLTQRDVELARLVNEIFSLVADPKYRDPEQRRAALDKCEQKKRELQAAKERAEESLPQLQGALAEADRNLAEAKAAQSLARRRLADENKKIKDAEKGHDAQATEANGIRGLEELCTSHIGKLREVTANAAVLAEQDTLQAIHRLKPRIDRLQQRDAEVREQQVCVL